MIGAHVGPSPAHSTWRATELSYRAAISLEGCSGFEWNILECSDEEVEQLKAFVSLYKELRGVLHHGTVMHADFKDPALRGRGVVSDDGKHAVWVVATVTNLRDVLTERLRMKGLDSKRTYGVRASCLSRSVCSCRRCGRLRRSCLRWRRCSLAMPFR